jgi:hypothetical protein
MKKKFRTSGNIITFLVNDPKKFSDGLKSMGRKQGIAVKAASTGFNKTVVDDKIVTNNKDDKGEYIEIDHSNMKSDQDYIVNYDNQNYVVKKLKDGKVKVTEKLSPLK